MSVTGINIDATAHSNSQWRSVMLESLKGAESFEIHCWSEETAEIDMALLYGSIKPSEWENGTVIAGAVTQQFIDFLMMLPKPTDTDIYNKMTPFFSIFLSNGFSSEHYGTELYRHED